MSETSAFWFDEAAARAAENFFDHVLVHVKGEWAGQPFTLDPWQREEVIRPLFGWKRRDGAHPDGWVRRYRVAYIEIPRKNGKSSLAAGIALFLLFADGEPGAEVYSAAADREQAGIVFELAREMVEARPILARRAEAFKRSIVCPENRGSYKVLSADAFTKHGLNASRVVVDELHAQPTRELVDVLVTSTESWLPQRPAGSHRYQAVHRLGGPVGSEHGAKRDVRGQDRLAPQHWANVRQAMSSSSIVVYKGHGLSMGNLPADPTEVYGRLNSSCLVHSEDPAGARLGTQDMSVTTNRLAENAIGFFCCHCTGGSASDSSPVTAALARRCIEAYSSTVMRIGGSGYFSGVNEEALLEDLLAHPQKILVEPYRDASGDPVHVYLLILWPDLSMCFWGTTVSG